MKPLLFSLTFAAGLVAGLAVSAAEVEARIENGALSFTGGQNLTNAVLMITGPGEFEKEETASRGLPVFRAQNSGRLADGLYQYSLTAATDEKIKIKNPMDNGRGSAARDYLLKPYSMQGSFLVSKGTILPADNVEGGTDKDAE